MAVKVSIIVPVYNVGHYIRRCLDSLTQQTLDDYEIIVVNDGSTDNSQKIIDEYQSRFPALIKSHIKENGGISTSRNYGLKYAQGEYLAFLDSDDYVEKDYYAGIYAKAKEDDADLVIGDLEYVWEDHSKEPMRQAGIKTEVNPDIRKALMLSPLFSWNKLYKRSFFMEQGLTFPVGQWYEDIPVALKCFTSAPKIAYYPKVGVHYVQRNTSILNGGYSPKMYDLFTIFERVYRDFEDQKILDEYHDELEYLFVEHFLVYGAFRFLRTDEYRPMMNKAFDFVKTTFPDYRHNPYIKTFNYKNRLFLKTNNPHTLAFWHWYLTR